MLAPFSFNFDSFISSGIDLGSILEAFWHIFHFFLDRFLLEFSIKCSKDFGPKRSSKSIRTEHTFWHLFRRCSAGCVFESFLPHFGSLLAQFWSLSEPFCLRFRSICYQNLSLSTPETAKLLQILAEGIPPSKGTINILNLSTIIDVYLTPLPSGCALLRLRTRIHIWR